MTLDQMAIDEMSSWRNSGTPKHLDKKFFFGNASVYHQDVILTFENLTSFPNLRLQWPVLQTYHNHHLMIIMSDSYTINVL